MRIVVLGANGGVGRAAVSAAAQQGHDVVAAARTTLPAVPSGVAQVELDVRDASAVQRALVGAQGVLWCVGVTKRSGGDVGRTALPHVLAAATAAGVTRLVTVSGAGVTLPGDAKPVGARLVSALTRRLARDLVIDKEGEHRALVASALDWTQVRPPRLVDGPATGRWSLTDQAPGITATPVPRADVALAMLHLLAAPDWSGRSPFLVLRAGPADAP